LKYTRFLDIGTLPYFTYDMESNAFTYEIQPEYKFGRNILVLGYEREFYDFYHRSDTTEINKLLIPPSLRNPLWPVSIKYLYQVLNGGAPFENPYYMVPYNRDNRESMYAQIDTKITSKLNLLTAIRRDSSIHFNSTLSKRFSTVYERKKDEFYKFIYSTAYRFPHMGEKFIEVPWMFVTPHLDIEEEKIRSLEYVLDKSFRNSRFVLSYYRLYMDDIINMGRSLTPPYIYPKNVATFFSSGIEFTLERNFNEDTSILLGASWNDTDALDPLYEVPDEIKNMFYFTYSKKFKKFNFFYTCKVTGKRTKSITKPDGFWGGRLFRILYNT